MNDLQQYFEDRKQFVELLEAVGISTLKEFSAIDPFTVLPELHQAKRILKLETEIPAAPVFREWVAQALTAPRAASPDRITQSREEYSYRPAKPASVQEQPKTYLRKKGIKHLTPFRTWIGAVAVLLFFASSISAIVLTTMMLLNGERGWQIICLCFGPWILALILYLAVALPRKCSVCRAPLFSFKKYNRNKAAHHIPLFGYVFATALHIFLFNWFRCPACGSAQQLGGKSPAENGRH